MLPALTGTTKHDDDTCGNCKYLQAATRQHTPTAGSPSEAKHEDALHTTSLKAACDTCVKICTLELH
jgi:hypothetical protein